MAGYRVLDIETVPDSKLWMPGRPKYDLEPSPVDFSFSPIFTQRDEFPPPIACQVVALAHVDLSDSDNEWYFYQGCVSLCELSPSAEAPILKAFIDKQEKDNAILVSWNGRTFDLPVINLRSLHHKLQMRFFYNDREVRYRYSELGHLDLMDVFSDYGAARFLKLGDVARAIGLPGKEGDVKGGSVHEVYLKAQFAPSSLVLSQQVADYCLSDALQTALLFIRSRYHRGMIDGTHHDKVIDSFIRYALNPEFNLGKWHARRVEANAGVIDWEGLKIGTP